MTDEPSTPEAFEQFTAERNPDEVAELFDAETEAADDEGDEPGVIGALGTQTLAQAAADVVEVGRSSHTAFGDRIQAFGQRLADLAAEARRRLSEDRLPDDQQPEPVDNEPAAPPDGNEPEGGAEVQR